MSSGSSANHRLRVVPLSDEHRPWLAEVLTREWGSPTIISRGKQHDALQLPAFVAIKDNAPAGAVTYEITGDSAEIVTLNCEIRRRGIGSALMEAAAEAVRYAGCRRLWLVTTNDNTDALAFYQKRGFRIVAVHRDAVITARERKPEIPMTGAHGIPIRDELELEIVL